MPFGLAFDAQQQLYATDNGREGLGHDLPPDEVNRITAGADYGWPRCWGQHQPDADGGGDAASCATTNEPVALLPAHSGVTGIVFYQGSVFPANYHGDALIGLSGSWYSQELGFVRQDHLILLLAICVHDALVINYWLHQSHAQAISVDANQQMQVDPARTHWYQPWVIAFSTKLLLFVCSLPVFGLTD